MSCLRSNAFKSKANGKLGEGEVYNTITKAWEEPDVEQKGHLLGFQCGDTTTLSVTVDPRAVRLRRVLNGNTMRWLGAFLDPKLCVRARAYHPSLKLRRGWQRGWQQS